MSPESGQQKDEELAEGTLVSHLVELRTRLIRSALAVLVIFICLVPFAERVFTLIATPLMERLPEGATMIATQVASPFLTPFKMSLFVAVFLAMPVMLYQVWLFVAPGLYRKEKRFAYPLLLSSIVLFYAGVAFAYYVVFPLMFAFFAGVAPEGVTMMTDISAYLDFILTIFFTRETCPLTRLENKIRTSIGMSRIGGFIGHYVVRPIRRLRASRAMKAANG